jgi:hypothetical protein
VTPRRSIPRLLRAAALLALLPACKAEEKKDPNTPPLPPGAKEIARADRLPNPTVSERCYSPPVRTVFRSKLEWDGYWGGNAICAVPALGDSVDWEHEMLIFAAMGKRMAEADRISIDATQVRNDSLIVVVRRFMLKSGCPAPRVVTFPQSLVKVPVQRLPVRFSEAHVKVTCEPE